jgi:hypothetical protein
MRMPNLAAAASDEQRDDAVDPNRGERQRQPGKQAQQQRREPRLRERIASHLFTRSGSDHR